MTELKKLMNKATTLNFVAELETKRGWRAIESIEKIINMKLLKRDHETITNIFNNEHIYEDIKKRLPQRLVDGFYYDGLEKAFFKCLEMVIITLGTHEDWKNNTRFKWGYNICDITTEYYWWHAVNEDGQKRDCRRSKYELYDAINYLYHNSELCIKLYQLMRRGNTYTIELIEE